MHRAAAAALAELKPALPAWLADLTQPPRDAAEVLRGALQTGDIPDAVRQAFRQTCVRRQRWYQHGLPGTVAGGPPASDWEAASQAAEAAEHAGTAFDQECAWLLTSLCDLLFRQSDA
jgi:hypothetical protein